MNSLQMRLVQLASQIYELLTPIMKDQMLESVVKQLIRSSTSIGANYSESQASSSYKDFHNKIKIAQKELKETEHWLTYLKKIKSNDFQLQTIEKEIIELQKIFATIAKKADLRLRMGQQ